MARHSKLQKQVLKLYKQFLRAAKDKPGFLPLIQEEFHKNSKIPRMDVMHIEYLYRRGQRQLELLKESNTKQVAAFIRFKPPNGHTVQKTKDLPS
ncbi:succinate dehydrogenase assembly factor 1, mitochondrial [Rhinoraja longicauda]